jgi:hypothetical protein
MTYRSSSDTKVGKPAAETSSIAVPMSKPMFLSMYNPDRQVRDALTSPAF